MYAADDAIAVVPPSIANACRTGQRLDLIEIGVRDLREEHRRLLIHRVALSPAAAVGAEIGWPVTMAWLSTPGCAGR
jgi:hypothetical protein